jgi:hypothetical protein
MRYVVLFFLLIRSITSYSQLFHVGEPKETVVSVLNSNEVKFTESEPTDSTSRISVLYENEYQMIWVLDAYDVVIKQTLIPEMENGVNKFVKWFNQDFVVISDTEWRDYSKGRIYVIRLEYIYQEPIFLITLSPSSN